MIEVTDFVHELLKPAPAGSVAWCTFFAEPPEPGAPWGGQQYTSKTLPLINGVNAYYSIATFPAKAPSRTKDQAHGAGVVLCDDVGTKAEPSMVLEMLGEPSFKIRTSPSSQQWGYFLERLATDEEITPIHERLLALRLCDKNGNNLVRYGRLPAGINNKREYSEPFAVRGEDWHPGRRFQVEWIMDRLSAAENTAPRPAAEEGDEFEALAAAIESGEDYHDPLTKLAAKYAARSYTEPDIVALLQGRMLASEDRSGRWQARYDDIRRTVRTAMKFAPPDRGDKIVLRRGRAWESVLEALAVLARRGVAASLFVRGCSMVRPHLVERRGFNDEAVQSLELAALNPRALAHELNGLINFSVRDRNGRSQPQDCPPGLAATVLSVPHEWRELPRLDLIAAVPIYRGAGRLVSEPGYHEELHAWLTVPRDVRCEERPTRAEAEAALLRLQAWIEEFPFADAVDGSVMLAAMLTAALRPSLPSAPAFGFDAPEFGSGKTTAAKLVNIVLTGRPPAVMQFSEDGAEELRKHVQAAMIDGYQSLVIDNVPAGTVLTSAILAQLLTEPFMDARELGASRTHRLPCTQLVLATGNNLQVGDDLTRRVLVSRQDPRGDPTARVYKRPNLLAEAQVERGALLSDLFTLTAAYEASGIHARVQTLVGYGRWARWVQEPLVWLGCVDPVESVRRLQAEDPERDLLNDVTDLWHAIHGTEWVGVKELAAYDKAPDSKRKEACAAMEKILADECGRDREGNLNRRSAGRWLKRMKGRWAPNGLRLEQHPRGEAKTKRSALWRVVAAEGLKGYRGFSDSLRASMSGNEIIEEVEEPSCTSGTLHDDGDDGGPL